MQRGMKKIKSFSRPPEWVENAIVYQVFPDRFRRSNSVKAQEQLELQEWGSDPSLQGFHGGDLYGVMDSIDHFEALGINCIYLTPVFASAANHRYHTYDYFQVDPILGGNKALEALINALHSRGLRIILDGVFNHCGRGFWAFHHLLENGETSPYKNWFSVNQWPIFPYPKKGQNCGYSCWWNNPALPKFNHQHEPVRNYLLEVATYWMEKGIDGWRLDVPDEIPFEFWEIFRKKVKEINPQAWIIGEIWGDARPWLKGKHFDGVMNYRIGWSSLSWAAGNNLRTSYRNPYYPLKKLDGKGFINIIETTLGWYQREVNNSQLNLLDSHDVPRALNTLKGDIASLKIALLLLFIQPGAPCIYYGTEAGLVGGKDPFCRESFPWDNLLNTELSSYIFSLVSLRQKVLEVAKSDFKWKTIGKDGLLALLTRNENTKAISIVLNRSLSSSLKLDTRSFKKIFLLGNFDSNSTTLGPQSCIVIEEENLDVFIP